jgi:energy-coupling factor transport system ATP-binding protein
MAKNVVEVRDLSFRYRDDTNKTKAIGGVSFDVLEGEFFCIIGANGSGKSTLCNALVGLVPHYFVGRMKGSVKIHGVDTASCTIGELSTRIGLVFQNPFNQLSYTAGSVAEELAYGLGNRGVPREEMVEKVARVAKLMRIDHIINKNPLELSGGQVQRVAFGSTFILEPSILVLDECTTQLDPLGSEEIFDIVKELNKKGITVIMVDHDMERVARCADRVMVMEKGKVVEIGAPSEVFGNPALSEHRVNPPDYVAICRALEEKGYYHEEMRIDEESTTAAVKELLN